MSDNVLTFPSLDHKYISSLSTTLHQEHFYDELDWYNWFSHEVLYQTEFDYIVSSSIALFKQDKWSDELEMYYR